MKRRYENPQIEITFFRNEDSIRTSGENDRDNTGKDIFETVFDNTFQ